MEIIFSPGKKCRDGKYRDRSDCGDIEIRIDTGGSEAPISLYRAAETRGLVLNELNINSDVIEEKMKSEKYFDSIMSGGVEPIVVKQGVFRVFGVLIGLMPILGFQRFLPSYRGLDKGTWDYTLEEFSDKTLLDKKAYLPDHMRTDWKNSLLGRAFDHLYHFNFGDKIKTPIVFSVDHNTYGGKDYNYWFKQRRMREIWDEMVKDKRDVRGHFGDMY